MDAESSEASEGSITGIKEMRQWLESRVDTVHASQLGLIASLQTIVPDLVSSLNLSLKAISTFENKPFTPLPENLPSNSSFSKANLPKLPLPYHVVFASAPVVEHSCLEKDERGFVEESGGVLSGGPMNGVKGGGSGMDDVQTRTEEDELKEVEDLLNRKSFREMQKLKTGQELLDLINKPTFREVSVADKFKTKGGSQVKEYCSSLTKEDCQRKSDSFLDCDKIHFRRIIAAHTEVYLGDCPYLGTCRHMKTCRYVHYELDSPPPRALKPEGLHYCSKEELGEPQWINCDIRTFKMDILGKFGVIMADPPWDIHMELPYGTMADNEMRTLNVPALQTDGLIFLWVTGRAMELGRECLQLWGYQCIEEIIWVKTNQLNRIIRTGRTGHWLNHSKEHCLVGVKGNPVMIRNMNTDVIVAEVRETSRKPDEMYRMLERISPGTRKLELFARMHNVQPGWLSLGNQLEGVRLVDEGLRARFKAAYPNEEVQPLSPPRADAMDVDRPTPSRSACVKGGNKSSGTHSADTMNVNADMAS